MTNQATNQATHQVTNQELVIKRSQFIRFVRTLKQISVNDASGILSVSKRTIQNYETSSVPITDKIFNHVIKKFNVTDYEIRIYLEYHEGREIQ